MDPTFYLYRKYKNNISNYQYYITLVFIDEQLENVIVALEENYNISIHIKGLNIDSDLFTGKVPSNDLLNALEILKYSYHMDYRVDAKDIYFSKK